MNNDILRQLEEMLLVSPSFDPPGKKTAGDYDPEMLYVECRHCGKPIMWERGQTTALLARSDISPFMVDEHCLILSDGCKACAPRQKAFTLSIVRLAGIGLQDLLLLQKSGGNA